MAILDALSLSRALRAGLKPSASPGQLVTELRQYEEMMLLRGAEKVGKSRLAAEYLHSTAALHKVDITRAAAAELSILSDVTR